MFGQDQSYYFKKVRNLKAKIGKRYISGRELFEYRFGGRVFFWDGCRRAGRGSF
jgi:hypothetical protein